MGYLSIFRNESTKRLWINIQLKAFGVLFAEGERESAIDVADHILEFVDNETSLDIINDDTFEEIWRYVRRITD